jgi:hypothetical protein
MGVKMPNRLRYRPHAMLETARCFGTEPVPMSALAQREAPSRNPLPPLPVFLARLPVMRCVLETDVQAAIAEHAHSITGIDVHSACWESSASRSCLAGEEKMTQTQTGLED